ncbi:hypothetical protein WICMUC_002296 [Wickerhamomyces mucosus]|uniref:ER lumen protein-retaining receptor n=1 Tax=Wickerhamomyces mucosus TaxID=1378264 RepID=A0A9P8PQU2_9ASCO|nr:hypothetical protein WICMUC_002296 [Wickerhamomyces mucosus]
MLNIFRIAGDTSHLVSILILINTIQKSKSIAGISFKTQLLYSTVFITRYIDLTFRYISLYNTLMKLFFIGSSLYILYLMNYKYKSSETQRIDTFKIEYLLGGSFILGLIFTYDYSITEILWSFSLWLESVAILPQLFMLQRTGTAQNITTHYIFALGIYRALYIPNWLYRYFAEGRFDALAIFTGIVQTLVYSDFFWIYYNKVLKGLKFELPQ